jgi:hypothetical protein
LAPESSTSVGMMARTMKIPAMVSSNVKANDGAESADGGRFPVVDSLLETILSAP